MRLPVPLNARPDAPLARLNPVAKLAGALLLMIALFLSLDPVTPALILAALIATLPFSGLPVRALPIRLWPLLVAALSVGIVNVIFTTEQVGPVILRVGPISVGAGTLATGGALVLRLCGFALSGVIALATTDPADLANALVSQLRASARFAVGALAALRLLPVLGAEWQTVGLAQRARGVDAGRSPVAAIRQLAGRLLGLLVSSVRRGTRLALAMEARGFGASSCRTVARPQAMTAVDWAWVAGSGLVGVGAVAVSVLLGSWRFLFG